MRFKCSYLSDRQRRAIFANMAGRVPSGEKKSGIPNGFSSLKVKKAKVPQALAEYLSFKKPKYSKLPEDSIFNATFKGKRIHFFMYQPKRKELLIASESKRDPEIQNHADLFNLFSTVQDKKYRDLAHLFINDPEYDKFVKGWFGVSKEYPYGIIHFHFQGFPEDLLKKPEYYDRLYLTLKMFQENGAIDQTKVRGIGNREVTLEEIRQILGM